MNKDVIKFLIKEFHQRELPEVHHRTLLIPDIPKIISISGVRRSGKTYYFYQIIKELLQTVGIDRIIYINFADDRLYPMKLSDMRLIPEAYFELYPENKQKKIYFFFDEIQEIDKWELFVRRIYDTENAEIYVTGSSSKLLHNEINTILRGRTLNLTMYPLSFREFLEFHNIKIIKNSEFGRTRFKIKKLFDEYLNNGGFPEAVLYSQKRDILDNYLELIIYRDIVERYGIRNLNLMRNLIHYLMTSVSSLFSTHSYYKAIKGELTVKKGTINEYLSYIEDAHLAFTTKIFSYSLKQQQVNPRKIYCIDNGLRNAGCFRFSKDEGRLAENLVFIHFKRKNYEIFYWKKRGEVDFVVKNYDNSLTAVNVTFTDDIPQREIESLKEFNAEFKNVKKLIILTKDSSCQIDDIECIPLWKWLLD